MTDVASIQKTSRLEVVSTGFADSLDVGREASDCGREQQRAEVCV